MNARVLSAEISTIEKLFPLIIGMQILVNSK